MQDFEETIQRNKNDIPAVTRIWIPFEPTYGKAFFKY